MSYIEVEIGGKVRGLKFNNYSLEIYLKHIDDEAFGSSAIYSTFFAGLCGNCYVKREEVDFSFENVTDWVDKMYEDGQKENIKKVCDLFADTQQYKELLLNVQDKIRGTLKSEGKKVKKKMK